MSTAASFDGVTIAYEARGTGSPTLVLVHGWSCDRSYWRGQFDALAEDFRVVALDLAGHGESGNGRRQWTIASFGEDVAGVANALGLDRMVLVGHSMGGDVILEAARRLAGRVIGLVWVDSYSSLKKIRTPAEVESLIAPFRDDFPGTAQTFVRGMFGAGAEPSLVDWIATDMASAPAPIGIAALEATVTYDREVASALRELALPLVAINPDYRPTDADSLAAHGIELLIQPDSGHFLMMENPQRFNPLLRRALARLAERAAQP